MNAKHTPGPWKADASILDTDTAILDSEGLHIGCIYDTHPEGGDAEGIAQQVANARLISAAPELLQALEDLAAVASTFPGELSADHYSVKAAKAAIAKAKGET